MFKLKKILPSQYIIKNTCRIEEWILVFENIDAIISPTVPEPPIPAKIIWSTFFNIQFIDLSISLSKFNAQINHARCLLGDKTDNIWEIEYIKALTERFF